jgi:hypothetical protein
LEFLTSCNTELALTGSTEEDQRGGGIVKKVFSLFCYMVLVLCIITVAPVVAVEGDTAASPNRVFNEQGFGYTIEYPEGWIYYTQDHHTVIFIGEKGTDSSLPTVTMKNILSDKAGGAIKTVDDVIADLEDQLKMTSNPIIFDPQPLQYDKDGVKLAGKLCVAEYSINAEKYRQWMVVLPNGNGTLFHVWTYTAPAKDYDKYFFVAQKMFTSWTIKD